MCIKDICIEDVQVQVQSIRKRTNVPMEWNGHLQETLLSNGLQQLLQNSTSTPKLWTKHK